MKKLLVLMLVLCMASAASALTLTITADEDDPFALIAGGLDQDLYIGVLGNGALTYTLYVPPAPSLSLFFGTDADMVAYGYGHLVPAGFSGDVYVLASSTGEAYVDGVYLRADGVAGDQVNLCWFDPVSETEGVIGTVTLVPEPMTIALLGLGSLLMLRRRK